MLKIWGRTNSLNVQKVMWTVAELGLEVERVDAGLRFGVVGEDWYGALNPNRQVPTVDDDGLVLWESNVIVRYLAAKHASGTLMPADSAGRAKAEMWMDWQQTEVMPHLTPAFMGLIRTPPEKRNMAAIEAGLAGTARVMRRLDQHLDGRAHVAGDHLTVGDIPIGCVAYRWYSLPIEHPNVPNLRAWYERLTERAGFKAHVMLPLT